MLLCPKRVHEKWTKKISHNPIGLHYHHNSNFNFAQVKDIKTEQKKNFFTDYQGNAIFTQSAGTTGHWTKIHTRFLAEVIKTIYIVLY